MKFYELDLLINIVFELGSDVVGLIFIICLNMKYEHYFDCKVRWSRPVVMFETPLMQLLMGRHIFVIYTNS